MISRIINGTQYLFVKAHAHDSFKEKTDEEMYFNQSSWKIIGKASELTEEQWRGIVKMGGLKTFRDYTYIDEPDLDGLFNALLEMKFKTATESGLSIMLSLDLNPETTLILQKQ